MEKLPGKAFVYLKQDDVSPGETLFIKGTVREFETATNPGQFDSRLYYQNRGILFSAMESTVLETGYICRTSIATRLSLLLGCCRDKLAASLDEVMDDEDSGILRSAVLGEKEAADPQQRDLLQDAGMGRLLYTSGMYLSLLGMGLFTLLRRRRFSFISSAILSSTLLCGYGMMAGMGTGLQRSMMVFMIWCGGQVLGRSSDLPTSLGIASFVLLTGRPSLIMDAGYGLSFGSMMSMIMFSPGLEILVFDSGCNKQAGVRGKTKRRKTGRPYRRGIAAGLAAIIGTLPLTEWYFYRITPLASLLQIPLFAVYRITFLAGMAGAGVGLVLPYAGRFIAAPCHFILAGIRQLSALLTMLPGTVIITGRPHAVTILVYYTGILLFLHKYCKTTGRRGGADRKTQNRNRRAVLPGEKMRNVHRQRIKLAVLGYTCLLLLTMVRFPASLRLIFMDVGQGEAILVQTGSRSVLIDCGSSSMDEIWKRRVNSCLQYYGIRNLDAVFISHADDDHTNGLKQLLSDYTVNLIGRNAADVSLQTVVFSQEAFAISEDLQNLSEKAEKKGINTLLLKKGNAVHLGKAVLINLFPDVKDVSAAGNDTNQSSMVLLLTYPGLEVLLTGDLEREGEQRLVRMIKTENMLQTVWPGADKDKTGRTGDGHTDDTHNGGIRRILKVPHHGSRNGTSEELLAVYRPDLAVISCGLHNHYGHPSEQVLLRLHKRRIPVLRTDRDGSITINLVDPGKQLI